MLDNGGLCLVVCWVGSVGTCSITVKLHGQRAHLVCTTASGPLTSDVLTEVDAPPSRETAPAIIRYPLGYHLSTKFLVRDS